MHHTSNSLWQIDNDIQQQQTSIDFWGWANAFGHWRTQKRINESNALLAENNALLEKIRRQLLTPAERAAEDAARRAAQAAAEAKRKAQLKTDLWVAAIVVAIGTFFIVGACMHAAASSQMPTVQSVTEPQPTPASEVQTVVEPQPSPTPVPAQPPAAQIAEPANKHHHRVRRAQLVRNP
jgi:hypothetical protein